MQNKSINPIYYIKYLHMQYLPLVIYIFFVSLVLFSDLENIINIKIRIKLIYFLSLLNSSITKMFPFWVKHFRIFSVFTKNWKKNYLINLWNFEIILWISSEITICQKAINLLWRDVIKWNPLHGHRIVAIYYYKNYITFLKSFTLEHYN